MLSLTFGVADDGPDGVESGHHVLRHLSHVDVLDGLERLVAGIIGLLLVARVADSYGRVPVSAGHAFRFR